MGVTTTTNSAVTYVPIATTTLSVDTASYTFSSITGTYTDLIIMGAAKTTRADYDDELRIRVNGDTATNYSTTWMSGDGTSAGSSRGSNLTYAYSRVLSASATPVSFTPIVFNFMNYANTTTYKTILNRYSEAPAGGASYGVGTSVNLWRSTAAITSITLFAGTGNLAANSTFTLYGILGA